MTRQEAADTKQPGGEYSSEEWKACLKRELRRSNAKARRMRKKLEGGK
jgi:hypothetical protein